MVSIPTINLAQTGANIMKLRKDARLTVRDLQMAEWGSLRNIITTQEQEIGEMEKLLIGME